MNALNVNYSDNGLFGIYAISDGSVMDKVSGRARAAELTYISGA